MWDNSSVSVWLNLDKFPLHMSQTLEWSDLFLQDFGKNLTHQFSL